MGLKLIKNISYFESTAENITGNDLPAPLGTVFDFPQTHDITGKKIALLLRSHNFMLPDFEHLYINFTTALPSGEMILSERRTEKWLKYVDYGMEPAELEGLSDEEKNIKLLAITEEILLYFFAEEETQRSLIHACAQQIIQYGEKLEITFQAKYDKVVDVFISFMFYNDSRCRVIATVKDHQGEVLERRDIVTAECFTDAMQYVGTILVRKNRVVIKPRNNVLTKEIQPVEIIFSVG